jgi:cytochrome c551/c552
MKKPKNLLRLLIAAVVLVGMFAACEGPEGPAGPKGDKGDPGDPADPLVNWEGFKEGIKCADCHNPDVDTLYNVWGVRTQWSTSKHASGGAYFENDTRCVSCHTMEGFVQEQLGRPVIAQAVSSPIGCFACHSPHSRAEFSLRTVEPVLMLAGVVGAPDETFDYGKGNLCASCHKPRPLSNISPKPDPTKTALTDSIVITSPRWYQHYGVQGLMLAGFNGFEFQGVNYTNSPHTNNDLIQEEGCGICHMALEPGNPGGGHSMWLETEEGGELLEGCNLEDCHNGGVESLDYEGSQTFVEAQLDTLQTLLLERNWITESGSVNASTSNPLIIKPAYLSGAMYNYFFVEHDLSLGVHNTKYTQKLLSTSIAKLLAE